ncbi:MAG: lipase, partial [Rhodobacteraceae bacterium]|nr:lipase [Paracoccaceae bacterium]
MAYCMRVALAVLASAGWVSGAAAQVAPPDAFYSPQSPLPAGAPGSVIQSMPLASSAALPSAARNLVVLYHSRDESGRDAAVSGTVAIPPGAPPPGGWPVLTWFHGTTG